jgi:predicted GNAT superfamily acetyltransferase
MTAITIRPLAPAEHAWALALNNSEVPHVAAYGSANYRWFCERYDDFLYIDRVVADPAFRGRGVGRALYDHAIEFGRGRAPLLTCEVNETPPNPDSMRFHENLGFRPLGRQETEGGAKSVVLLGLDLSGQAG